MKYGGYRIMKVSDYLEPYKKYRTKTLAKRFGVSPRTMQRYLQYLEENGYIKRTYLFEEYGTFRIEKLKG